MLTNCPAFAEDAKAASPVEDKPAEQPDENGDAPSAAAAELAFEGQAAGAGAQADPAAIRRRVFRGVAPPATLLDDLARCERASENQVLTNPPRAKTLAVANVRSFAACT